MDRTPPDLRPRDDESEARRLAEEQRRYATAEATLKKADAKAESAAEASQAAASAFTKAKEAAEAAAAAFHSASDAAAKKAAKAKAEEAAKLAAAKNDEATAMAKAAATAFSNAEKAKRALDRAEATLAVATRKRRPVDDGDGELVDVPEGADHTEDAASSSSDDGPHAAWCCLAGVPSAVVSVGSDCSRPPVEPSADAAATASLLLMPATGRCIKSRACTVLDPGAAHMSSTR